MEEKRINKQEKISFYCKIIAIIFAILAAIIFVFNVGINGRYIFHSITGESLPNSITKNLSLSKQDNYRLSLVYLDQDNDILSNRIDQINNDIYTAKHFHGKALISKTNILKKLHEIIISSKYYNYSYYDFYSKEKLFIIYFIISIIIAIINLVAFKELDKKVWKYRI